MGQALDVVRRNYDAFLRRDWQALFALYDPDAEIDLSRAGIPDLGVYRGHEGLREGWSRWRGVWDHYDLELEEFIESGDRVLAIAHVRARSKGHGVDVEFRAADLFRVRNGLIVSFAPYTDVDLARRDGGLMDARPT